MHSSQFNVRVPLPESNEVFLMNTLTDAQLIVSSDIAGLLDCLETEPEKLAPELLNLEEREALVTLTEHGFIVPSREADRAALDKFFDDYREDTEQLRVTVLTTLQCNFACDYCFQGDHGDYNKYADRMSPDTSEQVARWMDARMDELHPKRLSLTFFGGEPLVNLPALYDLAERAWKSTQERGVELTIGIISNGLLLTEELVDRLLPFGLSYVKITLDGDRETHDRMRPLRGGQGTFDRIIENVRKVAGKVRIAIGGNFDAASVASFPALLDFLKAQDFSDKLVKVAFKPIIREKQVPKNFIPLTVLTDKPLNGTCMSAAGTGGSSICDTCSFVDEELSHLREETKKRGFKTVDGVHMGPCEIHKRHAYTIGPNGSLFACPGFTGDPKLSTGHIDDRKESWRMTAAERFEHLAAWHKCGDCAFIPVCAGGCSTASHIELGDMNTPTCHKPSFESALISLAHDAASIS
ncbi:MAG TPA: radical SAM protein [Vicinamibacterales bacterium]|jgi:uncharacterized protein|nr:radical SAM protein [Vicinamibacterales bacterium]